MSSVPSVAEVLRLAGAVFLERGWLSSNNLLIAGGGPSALIDSGYAIHADQTLALVAHELRGQKLDLLLNTHLHSDHCGGNAALQSRYSELDTRIPPGHAKAVERWDEEELTYLPTGQVCPRFSFQGLLSPGQEIRLGPSSWEIHAAKGHDPHSVVLYQPTLQLLVSADALWQNGFGVVFPELEGVDAFDEVAGTLDLIESLRPQTVIPGHGPLFQDVETALKRARSRLDQFQQNPDKHHRHAMKVLIKFRLLEWQRIESHDLLAWARSTPYLRAGMPEGADDASAWLDELLQELSKSGALTREGNTIINR